MAHCLLACLLISFASPLSLAQESKWLPQYKVYNTSAYELYGRLLQSYKKQVRPVVNASEPIIVKVIAYIYQIVAVKQSENSIEITACFEMFWKDSLLVWNPRDYGGTSDLIIPAELVWTPEISAYYSLASNRMIENFNALRVNYTGYVSYFAPFAVTNVCPMDVKYFPFDRQKCQLDFGPWAYRADEQVFEAIEQDISLTDFFHNQEWFLEKTQLKTDFLEYQYLGQNLSYSYISIILLIQRKSFFYIFNLVMPTAIIAIVAVIGFHRRSSSSGPLEAKFHLGIMTTLSMTMILMSMVKDMPKFSLSKKTGDKASVSAVPLICIYNFALLCLVGCATITSYYFVYLERISQSQPIPAFFLVLANVRREIDKHLFGKKNKKARHHFEHETELTDPPFNNNNPHRGSNTTSLTVTLTPKLPRHPEEDPFIEEIKESFQSLATAMSQLRGDLVSASRKKGPAHPLWPLAIDTACGISLAFYLTLIFVFLIMFFFYGWY